VCLPIRVTDQENGISWALSVCGAVEVVRCSGSESIWPSVVQTNDFSFSEHPDVTVV
jgi:hypothetical protein